MQRAIAILIFVSVAPALAAADDAPALPNVVFILADDIGYGDIGCYGGRVPTPNIDRLAEQGMRFTDAHSPAALCAPSRFSMLTGSNPYRNGRPGGSWNLDHPSGFRAGAEHTAAKRHITVAEVMQRAGYRTGFFGKMHLGGTAYDMDGDVIRVQKDIQKMDLSRGIDCFPHEHGFDYALGLPSGIQHEPFAWFENGKFKPIDPQKPADNSSTRLWLDGRYEVGDNGTSEIVEHAKQPGIGDVDYDSSQVGIRLADAAVRFIDEHLAENRRAGQARPFLLYYCSQAIHVPHTPPIDFDGDPEPLDVRVAGRTGGRTSDMILELDLQVGRILDKLRAEGLTDDTLIIFTSDNGALWPNAVAYGDAAHDNNGPFRDYKASVYEGGHRVPFIARWGDGTPAGSRIKPGAVCDELIVNHDWVASMYDLTGQDMAEDQALDSATLLPLLLGRQPEGKPVHEFVIYQAGFAYDGAIRRGPWVLLVDRRNEATELYNLERDLAQEHNLIAEPAHAELVRELRAQFLRYNDHDNKTHEPRTTAAFRAADRTAIPD